MTARRIFVLLAALSLSIGCSSSSSGGGRSKVKGGDGVDPQDEGGASVALAPDAGEPGIWVDVAGSGFEASCVAEIFFDSTAGVALMTTDVTDGAFSARIVVPPRTKIGEHTIIAKGLARPEPPVADAGDGGADAGADAGDGGEGAGEGDGGDLACDQPSGDEARATFTVSVSQPPTGPYDFSITLKGRTVTPSAELDHDLIDEIKAAARPVTHALVQRKSLPRNFRRDLVDGLLQDVPANDVATLAELGVELLDYLNAVERTGTTYAAAISKDVKDGDPRFAELVRNVVRLEAGDKMELGLVDSAPAGEAISVLIRIYRDVSEEDTTAALARHVIAANERSPGLLEASATADQIGALAAEDVVQGVEAGPTSFLPTINDARAASGIDAVQQFDADRSLFAGLSGAGVQVGVMDGGIDASHRDFFGRLLRELPPEGEHGTNLAGVIAGSGIQSDGTNDPGGANGGDAFQFRGVAPEAQIAAYENAGGQFDIYNDAFNSFGVDLTNHSYVQQVQGLYSADVATVDALGRGDAMGILSRPAVWAAGNNAVARSDCANGSPQYPESCADAFQVGYFSILAPSKNAICVGSVDKDTLIHSPSSSLGPTLDGRLKPDLVAVGSMLTATGGDAGNGYRVVEGSSLAAPVVTGVAALLLERYAETRGVNLNVSPPPASLVKSVLIQTATDLEGTDATTNPDSQGQVVYGAGPDLATGYGLVNAEGGIALIDNQHILEGMVGVADHTAEFNVPVTPSQRLVRVTLAWDDVAGSALSSDVAPKLVNDLNLTLVAPDGTVHRPFLLPTLTPNDCDDDESNGVQVGSCAGIDASDAPYAGPAGRGVDRRNNVEQVLVEDEGGLIPGIWKARVTALHEDDVSVQLPFGGEQRFALAGVTDQHADISISVTASPDPVLAGECLFYNVEVTNNGPDVATDVTVLDRLPAGVGYATDTGDCVQEPPGTLTCKFGDLETSESREFRIKVIVDSNYVADAGGPTTVSNTVEVFSGIPDGNPDDNAATAVTIVEDLADLRLTKNCKPDRALRAGQTGTCTIFVDSVGPSTARNVRLADAILSNGDYEIVSVTSSQGDECARPLPSVIRCVLGDLPPASTSETGRASVTLEITANEAMDISDLATVESDPPDPNIINNEGTDDIVVDATADLALSITTGGDNVVAGNDVTYTFNVTNNGPSLTENVRVMGTAPSGVVMTSVTGDGGSCFLGVPGDVQRPTVCFLGSLANGESKSIMVEASVLPETTGVLQSEGRAVSETFDDDNSNNLAAAGTAVDAEADLSITLEEFPDPVIAGEQVTYRITVENAGPSTATEVRVTHRLPEVFTFVESQILGGDGKCTVINLPPQEITCDFGDIEPGKGFTLFVMARANLEAPDGASAESTVTVSTSATDPNDGNNSASTTTDVVTQADLAVTISDFPDPVLAGADLTFEVSVVNNGPSVARETQLRVTLPDNFTLIAETIIHGDARCASFNGPPSTLVCELGDMAPRETFAMFIRGTIELGVEDGENLEATATVTTVTPDPVDENNTASSTTAVIDRADLSVVKRDFPDPVIAGETLTYEIKVTNAGPTTAQVVVVEEELPDHLEYIEHTVTRGDTECILVNAPPLTLICEVDDLESGDTFSVFVKVRAKPSTPAAAALAATTTATSSTFDPDESNNTVTIETLVERSADLRVSVVANRDTGNPSRLFVFTVTVVNDGPSDAENVIVTDSVPTDKLSVLFNTGGCQTGSNNVVSCDIGTLAAGGFIQFDVHVETRGNVGIIPNTAEVGSSTPDPNTSNNRFTREVLVGGGVEGGGNPNR